MEDTQFQIEIISPDDQRIYDLEILRHKVFHLKCDSKCIINSYSIFHIKHHQTIPFALSIANEIVAGCYLSCYRDTLFVDYLFVSEKYQNSGLKLGRSLLSYILENKIAIEEQINHELRVTKLAALNDKARYIYKQMGFAYEENSKNPYMVKTI